MSALANASREDVRGGGPRVRSKSPGTPLHRRRRDGGPVKPEGTRSTSAVTRRKIESTPAQVAARREDQASRDLEVKQREVIHTAIHT